MDPHTARCLQLSTPSINLPLHQQYRRNAIAVESINRSRFPVDSSSMRPLLQRSTTAPNALWMSNTNNIRAVAAHHQQQQPITPSTGSLSVFSPQFFQDSPLTTASSYDGSFCHFPSQDIDFTAKTDGLGMHFIDNDAEFGGMTFSATTENFDDLIKLNDHESTWLNTSPASPDNRSVSSASSVDGSSELGDLEMSSIHPQQDLFNSIEMPTLTENVSTTTFQSNRRARSMSRPPAARSSSNRRFRRAPYSVAHTRSSSAMSNASAMSYHQPMSMPVTQCCTPVTEYEDNFLFNSYTADSLFETKNPLDQFFPLEEPMIAPKPIYSYEQFFANASNFEDSVFDAPAPMVLPSSGLSHDDCHTRGCTDHGDFADEPDLFAALTEEQSVPPEEDMNPEDPDMIPQEQEVRFEGDLYTPRFVRGHGNKREGYCGLCKPGRWLVLKNSAFWYDKSFTHGISAATGQPFDAPKQTRRMSGNPDVWEGLCGTCDEWIALISNKKKGTTWFRHAYKCHNHQKSKDLPKKRRETVSNSRAQSKSRSPVRKSAETQVSAAAVQVKPEFFQLSNGLQTLSAPA